MGQREEPSTSGRIHELIQDVVDPNLGPLYGGWSTLEEALAAVPEAALMKKASGLEPRGTQGRRATRGIS